MMMKAEVTAKTAVSLKEKYSEFNKMLLSCLCQKAQSFEARSNLQQTGIQTRVAKQ
jgi:hypothetical protein